MRRCDPQSIGEILRLAIEHYSLGTSLAETRAVASWPEIVGPDVAAACSRPSVNNGVMTVSVQGASLRQELSMTRSHLVRRLNDSAGKKVITELRIIS